MKWQSAHPDLLARCYSALNFLTAAGFRYFLPAYLLADLQGYDGNADPVFQLTHGLNDRDIDLDVVEVFQALSAQDDAVRTALEIAGISLNEMQNLMKKGREQRHKTDWREYSTRRFQHFTRDEREAIIRYLEFKAKDEYQAKEINQALDSYWRPSLNFQNICKTD